MTYKRLKSSNIEILNSIYSKVFKKFLFHSSYIFLCGRSVKDEDSFRHKINKKLPDLHKDIKIIYPENIFKGYLKDNPKKDMLELETVLASNADAICIIHESPGSFAELGAFTSDNNSTYFKRIIVLTEKQYSRKQTFLNVGPIKRVKNKYKKHQIMYDEIDLIEPSINFIDNLYSLICNVKKTNRPSKQYCIRITNLVGLAYFILIFLYIKNTNTNIINLKRDLNLFFKSNKEIANYYGSKNVNDKIYHASIHYLIEQEKFIEKNNANIKIKRNGIKEIERLIKVTKEKVTNIQDNIDVIKLANLEQKLYN
ncbi:putative uncharacterized protein [Clostridium sp. CAG:813]|nr:putative uncharacterized protein [Clostridium sp. CAG:813]